MSDIAKIKHFLSGHNIAVLEFDDEMPTAESAAVVVGCRPAEIAKSILLLVGGVPVLVVTSGDTKVNSSKLKQITGLRGKVKLPAADEVLEYTGYAPGGVCPFLLPDDLPVYLDLSLQRFTIIYPAAGNEFSAVPIDYQALKRVTSGMSADIAVPLPENRS